jgi:hypothetical protein
MGRQSVLHAGGDVARAKASCERLMLEAWDILAAHEDAQRALADAVFERGRLDEAAILEILGPYPEVSPETQAERAATKARHEAQAIDEPKVFRLEESAARSGAGPSCVWA